MRGAYAAGLLAILLAGPAHADDKKSRIGSFTIDTNQDPMTDRTNYFAMTSGSPNSELMARCLSGEENLLIAVMASGEQGSTVAVEARFDSGPVTTYDGLVVKGGGSVSGIQFGDADAVAKLGAARKAAVRLTMADGVSLTYTFALRESAKVAAGVKAACAPKDAPAN